MDQQLVSASFGKASVTVDTAKHSLLQYRYSASSSMSLADLTVTAADVRPHHKSKRDHDYTGVFCRPLHNS